MKPNLDKKTTKIVLKMDEKNYVQYINECINLMFDDDTSWFMLEAGTMILIAKLSLCVCVHDLHNIKEFVLPLLMVIFHKKIKK